MIDLALDPSETRSGPSPHTRARRTPKLRVVLLSVVGVGALGGVCVAASTLMAGLAAPAPVKLQSASRAADWPEFKDGLPVVAVVGAPAASRAVEPAAPPPRMAALSDAPTALPAPAGITPAAAPVRLAAVPDTPAKRIPNPTPVAALAPTRQVVPLPPARSVALQPPRASETVRARDPAQPGPAAASAAKPAASAIRPTASAALAEKVAHKAAAVRKGPATKPGETGKVAAAPTAVAQAEAPDSDETEVLGIKLPSLAPAGRKLRESVDALGEAVRKVF